MAGTQRLVPWVALVLVAGVGGAPPRISASTGGLVVDVGGAPPRISASTGGLVVDVGGAEPGWGLQLVRAAGQGCAGAAAEGGSTLLQPRLIQAGEKSIHFPAAGLVPGNYCAVVVSPTGNLTSLLPAEIKNPPGAKKASCSNWTALVTLKGDYNQYTIEASVAPRDHPGCKPVRVGLWLLLTEEAALNEDCEYEITCLEEVKTELREPSLEVLFEDLPPGNYCARVTPMCEDSSHLKYCTAITSRVLELPLPTASPPTQLLPAGGGGPEEGGRLQLWILLVPLLVVSALLMAVTVCWVRRRAWLAASAKKATLSAQLEPTGPPTHQPPDVVVRVVYSRDSEAHVGLVGALCALLQSELGVCVEYDEAATGRAHVTHDWALAMAHLPCPRFNSSSEGEAGRPGPVIKMLVLESDGALLKHQAYRQLKDVGLASGSSVDELYHTTYAALLSRQAQALGDYCHLLVARLPCTSVPGRLDLVPEKRFLLPHHLPQLLQALLHNYDHPEQWQQQQRAVAAALRSEARARLDRALAGCSANHREEEGMARLHLLLRGEGGGQEGQEKEVA